ncbi:hypothetical protein Acr_00g0002160 [Actinidia rufa]|uniref:NADH:quinone oxidoreductase/Mrp antiporter transmembrane domain-containing protein n=1 Tax=Actinidia rufa TaxID=165716 RepID=A0A7J0D6T0_9ERIC|nr:hypothetical protein Acr_00g0002160 [Actinidia rufa]
MGGEACPTGHERRARELPSLNHINELRGKVGAGDSPAQGPFSHDCVLSSAGDASGISAASVDASVRSTLSVIAAFSGSASTPPAIAISAIFLSHAFVYRELGRKRSEVVVLGDSSNRGYQHPYPYERQDLSDKSFFIFRDSSSICYLPNMLRDTEYTQATDCLGGHGDVCDPWISDREIDFFLVIGNIEPLVWGDYSLNTFFGWIFGLKRNLFLRNSKEIASVLERATGDHRGNERTINIKRKTSRGCKDRTGNPKYGGEDEKGRWIHPTSLAPESSGDEIRLELEYQARSSGCWSSGLAASVFVLASRKFYRIFIGHPLPLDSIRDLLTIRQTSHLASNPFRSCTKIGSHTWSPDAMEGPTPVSALIHAATMVTAGVFMIARCSPLFEYPPTALIVITFAGATTSFLAATTGILQNDLKRVIAYSTCSQLGYMIFACGISNYSVSVFHLMNHAFFKALLFLSAGSVIHAMSDEQDMRKMGFQTSFPFTYAMMLMGSLSLIGFPFLTGFYSKDVILELAYTKYTISGNFAFWHPGLRSRAPSLRGREENGSSLVIEGRAMLVLRVRICYLATIKGMPLSPVREGGGGVSYRPILDPAVHDAELPNMNTGKVKVGLHSSIRAGLRMLLVQRVKEADQEPIALGHHSFKSSPQPMIWYMVGLQLRRILHIQGRHSTKGFGADEDKDVLLFGIDYYHSTADVEMTKPCHASGPIFLFKNKKGTEPRLMTKGESETYNDTTPRTIHPGHKAGKSDTKEIFPYWTPIQYSILKRPKKEKRRMRPSSFFNEPHPGSFFRSVVGSPVRKLKVRRRREDWKAGVSQPCFCSPFISTRSDCPIVPKPLLTLPVRHSVHSAYRAKAFRNRPSIERWNQKHNGKWEIGLELRSQDWELRRFKRKPVKSFTSAYQAESDPKEKEPLSPFYQFSYHKRSRLRRWVSGNDEIDVVQDGEELLTLVWSEGEADGGSCTLAGRDLVSTGFRVWFGIPRSRREPLKFETSFHVLLTREAQVEKEEKHSYSKLKESQMRSPVASCFRDRGRKKDFGQLHPQERALSQVPTDGQKGLPYPPMGKEGRARTDWLFPRVGREDQRWEERGTKASIGKELKRTLLEERQWLMCSAFPNKENLYRSVLPSLDYGQTIHPISSVTGVNTFTHRLNLQNHPSRFITKNPTFAPEPVLPKVSMCTPLVERKAAPPKVSLSAVPKLEPKMACRNSTATAAVTTNSERTVVIETGKEILEEAQVAEDTTPEGLEQIIAALMNRGDNVRMETLVMAAKLSQGITLSLAPAALANIYWVFPPSPCPRILPLLQ